MSNYEIISTLNKEHKIYLVQSKRTDKIYVQKNLDIYNIRVYEYLYNNPIAGIPQIVNYYEQDNQLIVIEEYISGTSLQEKIDNSEISLTDVKHYMIMLCDILEKLHSISPAIIHRDIKPANIIITSYNYAVLIDFNVAKQFSGDTGSDTILLGTPGYAAPEQYGFGSSSPSTDIYSLGIVLKEMVESLSSVTNNSFKSFHEIIKKCTEMEPSSRYQSVSKLKEALMSVNTTPEDLTSTTDHSKCLPPGFRTKKPWKMLLSSVFYLFIFYICLTLEVENIYGGALWLERIFFLLIVLSPILCGFNYNNMQNIFPLCKSKNLILHYFGILLLDIIIMFLLMIIMFILEMLFFPT